MVEQTLTASSPADPHQNNAHLTSAVQDVFFSAFRTCGIHWHTLYKGMRLAKIGQKRFLCTNAFLCLTFLYFFVVFGYAP